MNMISRLRRTIARDGTATIDTDMFNQLQAEWIKRARIDRWISVEDRLPDVGSPVIACMKTQGPNDQFDSEWWFGCCIYREFGFPWVQIDNIDPITHWQPLPEPTTAPISENQGQG